MKTFEDTAGSQIVAKRPTGMAGFTIVWLGQLISFLGTGMTRFALTIWAWQVTGSATALSLVALFSFGPTVLVSPVADAFAGTFEAFQSTGSLCGTSVAGP